jgi:putative acyl-CoA dehydrogenase
LGSAALMRRAVVQAIHHAGHRSAFQKRLIDQPMMENVLADLAVESEAALWLSFRAAAALDASGRDEHERVLNRVLAPIAKYWVCKRAPVVTAEAMECHGGNGFVEDHVMARLYRDAPVNGLWEGSGNVICLDVLRAFAREPEAVEVLRAEIGLARGAHAALDAWLAAAPPALVEGNARRVVEHYAVGMMASLLLRYAPGAVAAAFCETRLRGDYGMAFGTLPEGVKRREILERNVLV